MTDMARKHIIISRSCVSPKPTHAKSPTKSTPNADERTQTLKHATQTTNRAEPARPAPACPAYGGHAAVDPARHGTARGPLAQTRSGFRVGEIVRNVGVGVWGFGTVVGVVPVGVDPRWYCRRHGIPMAFGARAGVDDRRVRLVVKCDDGRYHVPRMVEAVE